MKDKIFALREQGLSYRQIQAALGCSKGTIAYHLGTGQKEKTQQRNRDKRGQLVRYIQEYKTARPCTDCKEYYPYWIMEFDHLSDKSFNLSYAVRTTFSLDRIKEEVAKCEVVCANCHRTRTFARNYRNGSNCDITLFKPDTPETVIEPEDSAI